MTEWTSWRAACSLLVLRDQLDAMAPGRSRASDGIIGDAEHRQDPTSDHNPDDHGVVHAIDLTHDPAHGADMGAVSEALRASKDPRIKYVIFNRRIFSATNQPWVWRRYTGTSDPHTGHMHLSVLGGVLGDSQQLWSIGGTTMQVTGPDPWGDGSPNEQAAQLRDGFYLLAAGYQPDGVCTPDGVIKRLERIEAMLAQAPAVAVEPLDYTKLAQALLAEYAKMVL